LSICDADLDGAVSFASFQLQFNNFGQDANLGMIMPAPAQAYEVLNAFRHRHRA